MINPHFNELHQNLVNITQIDGCYLAEKNGHFDKTPTKEVKLSAIFQSAIKQYRAQLDAHDLDPDATDIKATAAQLKLDGQALYVKYTVKTHSPIRSLLKMVYGVASFIFGTPNKYAIAEAETKKAYVEYMKRIDQPFTFTESLVKKGKRAMNKTVAFAAKSIDDSSIGKATKSIGAAVGLLAKGHFKGATVSAMQGVAILIQHNQQSMFSPEVRELGKVEKQLAKMDGDDNLV